MAAPSPVGSVRWVKDHWVARITLSDGHRKPVHLSAELTQEQAKAKAYELQAAINRAVQAGHAVTDENRRKPVKPTTVAETMSDWVARYWAAKKAKGLRTVNDLQGRWNTHIAAFLGNLPMASIAPKHIDALLDSLDAKVAAGELSAKTALNVWSDVRTMFRTAVGARSTSGLRCLEVDVTAGMEGPSADGEARQGPVLTASEFLALMEAREVPLLRRQFYACAVYLAARKGELLGLTAADIQLERGVVLIDKQFDDWGHVVPTKTKQVRTVSIEKELCPLLAHLVMTRPVGRIFEAIDGGGGHSARELRLDLERAGLTRRELFDRTKERSALRFHDLRHTGLTWCAVRGDDPSRIKWRGGHSSLTQTDRYTAAGRNLPEAFGEPFPVLPLALCYDPASSGGSIPRIQLGRNRAKNKATKVEAAGVEPSSDCLEATDSAKTGEFGGVPERLDTSKRVRIQHRDPAIEALLKGLCEATERGAIEATDLVDLLATMPPKGGGSKG